MAGKRVLISGAGIAGVCLAYWLSRSGFSVKVVEAAPALRLGGHPVDLWGGAVDIAERMGVLQRIEEARTGNDRGVMHAKGRKPIDLDITAFAFNVSARSVEIVRGQLIAAFWEAAAPSIEASFADRIARLEADGAKVAVTLASGLEETFDAVIGADGLHSNVRALHFGPERAFSRYLGAYVAGCTIPNYLGLDGCIHRYVAPGKTVVASPLSPTALGVTFLFRREDQLQMEHDDEAAQKAVLLETFADCAWETANILARVNDSDNFYFDTIMQIKMEHWVSGSVGLVGDAGYGPGPSVGAGTNIAVVGSYVLAKALSESASDLAVGLRRYESLMRPLVVQSRQIGPALVKSLVPKTDSEIGLSFMLAPVLMNLPGAIRRALPLLPAPALRGMRAMAEFPIDG